MITILTDIIYQALAKGYERQHLRIQFSESMKEYLVSENQFVVIRKEDQSENIDAMYGRQFMGIKTELHPNMLGFGFTVWHDQFNPNHEIHPFYTTLLGAYTTTLGLPIK